MSQETERLEAIAGPHTTVADKIRALASAGVPRADIARFLGKRYQHVRNVLEGDAQAGGGGYVLGRADLSGVQDNGERFHHEDAGRTLIERRGPGVYWLRVRPDGSLPLPQELIDALDAQPGARVFAKLEGSEVKIISGETAAGRAREIVRKYAPAKSGSVVDEFLAERRAMWGEDD